MSLKKHDDQMQSMMLGWILDLKTNQTEKNPDLKDPLGTTGQFD